MKSNNIIDKVVNSNLSIVKKRLIVAIDLFDENGNQCTSYHGARKEVVTITDDVYTKDVTEKFNEKESYSEGHKSNISIYGNEIDEGNFDNFTISEEHIVSLPNELLERFKNKVDLLEIKFIGNINVTINSEFMTKIFGIFPMIKIDAGNKTNTIIEFPSDQKIKIESFELSGGNIYFKGNFRLQCDSKLIIENASIYGNDGSVVELVAIKPVLNQLVFNSLIYINIGYSGKIDSPEHDLTTCDISNVRYILNKFTDNLANTYTQPLLTILGIKHLSIFDISLNGADYAKFISVRSIGEMTICGLERTGKRICGNTIISRSCVQANLINITVNCEMDSEENTYVFKPDPSNYKLLYEISMRGFDVKNVSLIDLSGLTCGKVTISDGTFAGMRFISSENCDVNKLTFDNCKIVPGTETKIECRKLVISKTDIQFGSFSDDSLSFLGREGITISDSYIRMDKSNINFEIKEDCYLVFDKSYITCKNLDIHSSEDSEAVKMLCKQNSKTVKFNKCTISIYEAFKLHDLIYSLKFDTTIFNYVKEFDISGLTKFMSSKSYFEANEGVLKLNIEDCDLSNCDFGTNLSGENSNINLTNCTGTFEYITYDTSRDDEECGVTLKLKDSKVGFRFDSNGMKVKAKINSDNSLGSIVWGNNNLITVIPDIVSVDKNKFVKVEEYKKNYECVNYGGSSSEKEFYL